MPPKALPELLAEIKTATTLAEAQKIIVRHLGKPFPSYFVIERVGFGLQWVAVQEALIGVARREPVAEVKMASLAEDYIIGYARTISFREERLVSLRYNPALKDSSRIAAGRILRRADTQWMELWKMELEPCEDPEITRLRRRAFEVLREDLDDQWRQWERIWRIL